MKHRTASSHRARQGFRIAEIAAHRFYPIQFPQSGRITH
jgi:hypothetical protein